MSLNRHKDGKNETIMKRSFIFIIAAAISAAACEPIVKDIPMGGIVSAEDLILEITNENGGNKIRMENKTPEVGSLWDYGIGNSTLSVCEAVLPYTGDITINFTGICAGGTVTKTSVVHIDKITETIPEEWYLFANGSAEGKEWTWNDTADWCYGTGSYGWELSPDWDSWAVGDTPDVGEINTDDYFRFDLNGGANFTSYIGGTETKGTFVFDMSAGIEGYSIGVLTLQGASIPLPVDGYEGEGAGTFYKFDIIELTEDTLVLAAALDGQIFQDENFNSYATYWNFRKK